ncbi:MAG: c-type cytochrome [Paracoccaceae bacterium]
MRRSLVALAVLGLVTSPAFGAGDVTNGEKVFKQCQTCHLVAAPDGTVLAGRAGKTGPNLYAVVGRAAGSYPDYRYGDAIIAAEKKGLVWNEDEIVKFVADPGGFLKEFLDDSSARGKMTFKVKKEQDAHDVVAYLQSLVPPAQ